MTEFQAPQAIPQDLLLIYDILGPRTTVSKGTKYLPPEDEMIASSDGECASEDEIEAELKPSDDEDLVDIPDTSSEESGSSDDEHPTDLEPKGFPVDEEEDDNGPITAASIYIQTKNEITEPEARVPEIEEVGPEENLEKVGEVMGIVDGVVIIKGIPSQIANRANQHALDSETLLVFNDRKVLGYIYETFGPTTCPMYQIRFNRIQPPNLEQVRILREVFHVPERSKYVFLSQIRQFKGSDASNVYDEEPGEEEVEFSDDEAEAAHQMTLRRRRAQSRATSAASSRHSTPARASGSGTLNDYAYAGSAYDAHGLYDMDYIPAGSSRPAPIPYDDPYADTFIPDVDYIPPTPSLSYSRDSRSNTSDKDSHPPELRPRLLQGKDRGRGRGQNRGRGRGRGSDGGRTTSPHGWGETKCYTQSPAMPFPTNQVPTLPTFSTGQSTFWDASRVAPYPMVQPHINPRFAASFGLNFANLPSQPYFQQATTQYSQPYDPVWSLNTDTQRPQPGTKHQFGHPDQGDWTGQWTVDPDNS